MTIWADSLNVIYDGPIGCDATLTPGSGGSAISVRAIDRTSGIIVQTGDGGEVQSIEPAAVLRMSTLDDNDLVRADLDDGLISINSKSWRIVAHRLRPNPDGELKGEIMLLLGDEAL